MMFPSAELSEERMPETGVGLQGSVISGKYRIGRYLGGSERSAIFLTERKSESPQTAAIKLIPANPESAEAELSRLDSLAKLSHPHLLQIFEAGRWQHEGDELLYIVMEYAEENLEQILGMRPLTEQETDEMLKPTLEALAFLHKRGFVHDRIQPANILVAGEQLKLSSDGIRRIGEPAGPDNGTYAAPEQKTAIAPPRDIWSLGMTVAQALTQLLPVRDGEDHSMTLPETLPARFADLARNCLEPDPQRRCTLQEIADHLQYKLPQDKSPEPARPAKPVEAAKQAPVPQPVQAERPAYVRRENRAAARLNPPPVRAIPAPARMSRYAAAAIVVTLMLAMLFGGAKLLRRKPSQTPTSAVSSEQTNQQANASAAVPATEPELKPAENESKVPDAPPKKKSPPRTALKTASEVRNVYPAPTIDSGAAPAPGDSAPGKVIQQVLPDVPRSATNTIHGTVRVAVRVHVDPAGNILGLNVVSGGPSPYFARLAADTARQWKFSPPRRNGQAVASMWDLRFEFIRGATKVIPVAIPN
jgi:serine/threonine-protein kinase